MGATDPLHELLALSSQVREVALSSSSGELERSLPPHRGAELARAGTELLAAAASLRPGGAPVARVVASLPDGAVFVVAEDGRVAVATTVAEPTAGLVVYDLRTVLRRSAAAAPATGEKAPARRRKAPSPDA